MSDVTAKRRARKARRKRRSAIRATRIMYRLGQITKEDRDEFIEFWKTASDEKVLSAVNKAVGDAGLEPGSGLRKAFRKARGR